MDNSPFLQQVKWNSTRTGLVDPVTGQIIYVGRGEIALFGAYGWSAAPGAAGTLEASCVVPSSSATASPFGKAIAWAGTGSPSGINGVLFDTTPAGSGAFDPAMPYAIKIPAGVSYANFSFGAAFPTDATYGGTGQRVVRLIQYSPDYSLSNHQSNIGGTGLPPASGTFPLSLSANTGWIPVVPGDFYVVSCIQDSGASIIIPAGNYANKGGSVYFRAAFK